MITHEQLQRRLEDVRMKIARAANKAGRDPEAILLLPASKKQSVETLQVALVCGLEVFGENRVQEALEKIGALPGSVQWHFIGALQRNKVKHVVGTFHLIHSVDSIKLADEIEKEAAKRGLPQEMLIEVNIGREAAKHGCHPEALEGLAREINQRDHLTLTGLMTVAPFREDAEAVRPYFRQMRELRERLEFAAGWALPVLSMGMTHDFEVAIEEGATCIRVGTGLFGERQ